MTRRKGELTIKQVKRDWPYHVELLAEKVKGIENNTTVNRFARTLSAAPLHYTLYYDDVFHIVFCFKTAEDAQTFADHFGGRRLPLPR